MNPRAIYQRLLATLDREREYTCAETAALLGLHPGTVGRQTGLVRSARRGRACGRHRQLFFRGWSILLEAKKRAEAVRPHSGVIAKAESGNAKLGRAAITIVARQSCPTTCAFYDDGCYARHDNNRRHWDAATWGSADKSPLDLARTEAAAIDGLPGDRDLRLHVAGDSITDEGTRLIVAACERYVERGRALGLSVTVWGYTHGWRLVSREAWGTVSILASCETADDVREAHQRGYAAALVVGEFESDSAYPVGDAGKVLPCPQQTRDQTCTDCRLCFADTRLRTAKLTIGFALHGGGSNKARRALARRSLTVLPQAA